MDSDAPTDANRNYRIRPIYRGGETLVTVYEEEQDIPKPNTTEEITRQDEDEYRKRIVNTKYTKAPIVAAVDEDVQNTVVYQDLTEKIYRNDRVTYEAKSPITYNSTVIQSFPPVLASLSQQTWNKRDGTSTTGFAPVWTSNAWSGPCKATITETWSKSAPTTPVTIDKVLPTPIIMDTPIFNIRIPPCLHGSITITGTTGTTSDIWEYLTWDETFAATTPVTLGATLTIKDEVEPFNNGWIKRKIVVTPPF